MAEEPTNAPDSMPTPDPVSALVSAPVVTQPASFIADNGTFTEGWRDHYLTDDIKDHGTFKEGRIKDVQGLFRSLASAESMIGKDKIARPSESSTDEDWDEFHRAAGWTGELLPVTAPEGLPEGVWSEDRATKFSEKFNELRLSPKQVAGLVEAYNADLLQQVSDIGNNSETAVAELKASLLAEQGNAYTQFVHNGNIALEKGIDSPEHKERVLAKFATDPDFVRMMGNLGANFQEAGGIPPARMLPSPGDMKEKINEIMASDAFNNQKHPGHKAAVENLSRLTKEKFAIKQPA